MKLTFLGACHEVTGSCFLLNACGKNILIDCGMEQGQDLFQNARLPVKPSVVDAVILTHAHIDHSGNLPYLAKFGLKAPIFMTYATADLADIMLKDCAHIQESEAEWRNRKGKRQGKTQTEPSYEMKDALAAIKLFAPVRYQREVKIADGITATFYDAGHLLGSASVSLSVTEHGKTKTIVFSGDIGNTAQPLIKDPTYINSADYVVMESTYGDRSHGVRKTDYVERLASVIQRTFDRGGNVVIPSFAVGRTQEILYFIREIKARNLVKGHGNWDVFVDSPMAIEATQIFKRHVECCDEETAALIADGINPIAFDGLKMTVSSEESKTINNNDRPNKPKVIISASGMCEAGRIRHHLKHNLYRSESTILFVGYQAVGTTGRAILDKASRYINLFGERVLIRAEIAELHGVSAHADREGLLRWISEFGNSPKRVFIVHGEDETAEKFALSVATATGLPVTVPFSGAMWDLDTDEELLHGNDRRITKSDKKQYKYAQSPAYRELLDKSEMLLSVIRENEGGSNYELKNFSADIDELIEKYKR